jgi:hypothetical protein
MEDHTIVSVATQTEDTANRTQKILTIIIGSFQVIPEYNYLADLMKDNMNTIEKQTYFCEQFTKFKPDGIFYYPCNMAEFWNALAAYRQKYPLPSDPVHEV